MAPERRAPRENTHLFNLGVKGRKTGIELPVQERDENGLETMDHLFSSPEKPRSAAAKKLNGLRSIPDETITSEEDMDIGESTVPEPTAVLDERKRGGMRLPPPRSKSPIKTFLRSPARRNPSLGPVSSPIRGSIVEPKSVTAKASVKRKLDFSNASLDASEEVETTTAPQKRGGSAIMAKSTKLTQARQLEPAFSSDNDIDDEPEDTVQDDVGFVVGEDSYVANRDDNVEPEAPIEEPEEEPQRSPLAKKTKGKGKEVEKPAAKKAGRGRPKKTAELLAVVEDEEEVRPSKRSRRSIDGAASTSKTGRPKKAAATEAEEVEEPVEEERPVKKSKKSSDTSANDKASSKAKAALPTKVTKPKGRGKKLPTIEEADSPMVIRGPRLPKSNSILYSISTRRETPAEGTGFTITRSGRASFAPVQRWKGEEVQYNDDVMQDSTGRNMLVPGVKEIVRVAQPEHIPRPRAQSRAPSRAPKSRKRKQTVEPEFDEEDEDGEPWESEPGKIFGEVRTWDVNDQLGADADMTEEEIALSSAAIVTRDIAGATFRFAKTLTLPFYGAGMVDLPPGAAKKPKNSRKMQMCFFVFYGRVQVTVNDNEFGIGKGGMWQVPRGNFYSIENISDRPARIFFSQGCEIEVAASPDDDSAIDATSN